MRQAFLRMGFPAGVSTQSMVTTLSTINDFSFSSYGKILTDLQQPSMVVWAEDDPLIESFVQQHFADLLPTGPRLCFQSGGHVPHRQHHAVVAETIISWILQGLQ